ncbi:MAG: hypothetical protein ACRESW_01540, partial [Nevskiales bacterium]
PNSLFRILAAPGKLSDPVGQQVDSTRVGGNIQIGIYRLGESQRRNADIKLLFGQVQLFLDVAGKTSKRVRAEEKHTAEQA